MVPDLTPQPDGVLDFEDLTVFAQMWNGSFAHNGNVNNMPVATFHFRPKVHISQSLVLDYTLRNLDGDPIETGRIQIEMEDLMPKEFALHLNYPNPFNPTTTIRFELPKPSMVYLVIYDILGREVARLKQEQLGAGYHQVRWNGRDRAGRDLSSGLYFARLATPEYSRTIKLLLLK